MPINISSTSKLNEVLNRLEMLGSGIFPQTARAINVSASFIMRTWVNIAQGNDVTGKPDNVSFSGSVEYANSIRIISAGPFNKSVISDSPIGAKLEEGSPEYDMKPALVKGPRSRVAKDGHRYNIIPLRQYTKTLRSKKVGGQNAYDAAKSLTQQKIIGFKMDSEGKRRLMYAKWDREKRIDVSDRLLAGMVRMSSGAGSEKRSTYLTFRNVNLSQAGKWIRKAQSPWNITKVVADKTRGKVEKFVSDALKKDLGM